MIDGIVYPTTEHYFQAQKFPHNKQLQHLIAHAPTSRAAYDIAAKNI